MSVFEEYINQIEEIVDNGKPQAFSGRVSIDPEDINTVIENMRMNFPKEIKEAQILVSERGSILQKASEDAKEKISTANKNASELAIKSKTAFDEKKKAADKYYSEIVAKAEEKEKEIIKQAEKKSDEIVSVQETVKRAEAKAKEIITDAENKANNLLSKAKSEAQELQKKTNKEKSEADIDLTNAKAESKKMLTNAQTEADIIRTEAKNWANSFKKSAVEYIIEVLGSSSKELLSANERLEKFTTNLKNQK